MSFFLISFAISSSFGFSDSSIPVAPGGYAWGLYSDSSGYSNFTTVDVLAAGPLYGKIEYLPESINEVISLCPGWMQSDIQLRFTDLLYQAVQMDSPVQPLFADCNNDGFDDLVLKSEGEYTAYLFPSWLETSEINESLLLSNSDINDDGVADSAVFNEEGKLTIYSGSSVLMETEGFSLPPVHGTALVDMESDGLADLVVGTEGGGVLIIRNRGTATYPCFMPFYKESHAAFPMNYGVFSSPTFFQQDDSLITLALGTGQNGLAYYQTNNVTLQELNWSFSGSTTKLQNISTTEVLVGENSKLICATRDGLLYETSMDSDSLVPLNLPSVPGAYPSLTVALIDSDSYPDLVAGTEEGIFYYLPGKQDGWFESNWQKIEGLPLVTSAAPAEWKGGLVVGGVDGTLRYFLKDNNEEWQEATDNNPFSSIDVGEYSTPDFFNFSDDNEPELILGSSTGNLICYEFNSADNLFYEVSSWGFESGRGITSLDAYYSRYLRPFSVFCSLDPTLAEIYANQILSAEPHLRDEIAYCIANTPSDVLLAMQKNNDTDLFSINAATIYHQASLLSYVDLVDSEEGTKCLLNTESGWIEVSDENYYKFTVHPRILFETPARINAEYWTTPHDTTTSSLRDYLNVEIDSIYGATENHHFWRNFIPTDSLHGITLTERMAEAGTYEEAVVRLCNYLSFEQPNSFMSFGYMTNDLQPMVIYRKSYGSCGEQSILQTALCRTFFMPSFPVGCRGEDHQWNHYLEPISGRWNHWDINYGLAGLGELWVSGEGLNHEGKTISTIAAFDPDGLVRSVTSDVINPVGSGYMENDQGYTRTAAVEIIVTDPSGRPVEGAMILTKSHWDNADAVTAFDYTDKTGSCSFDLGWQVNGGYAFDIISPFGSTGTTGISFTEDSGYTLEYTMPYLQPAEQIIAIEGNTIPEPLEVISSFYPIPYFSRSLYSIATDTTGVVSKSSWVNWREVSNLQNLLYMDTENFERYKNGFNCSASLIPFEVPSGDNCFVVLDNRNSMFTWVDFSIPSNSPNLITDIHFNNTAAPREPVAGISLPFMEDNFSEETTSWVLAYKNMEINQDNPDDPLSSEVVIGPFKIPPGERSISLGTLCETPGLDLDLFLFMDKNSNRSLDGMNELLLSSTTPSANENIFINNPDTDNIYWLYLQGWQVSEEGGLIDIGLSFTPEPVVIHSLNPIGFVTQTPETFSFEFIEEQLNVTPSYVKIADIVINPEINEAQICSFEISDLSLLISGEPVQVYDANNELIAEFPWELSIDSVPPGVFYESAEINPATMVYKIKINYFDLESGIDAVTISVDSIITNTFNPGSDQTVSTAEINFLEQAGETAELTISVTDMAGNQTEETFNLDIPARSEVVFSDFFPHSLTYNHKPILQVLADFAPKTESWEALLTISGENSEMVLEPYIIDGDLIQFTVTDYLNDESYTAEIQVFNSAGAVISEYSWVFEIGTMTSTTGRNR